MVSIWKLLFFSAAVSSSLIARGLPQILGDLQKVDVDINKLTNSTNVYAAVSSIYVLQGFFNRLLKDLQTTSSDAAATPPLNTTDSTTLLNYLRNPITLDFTTMIDALVAKAPLFKSQGAVYLTRQNAQFIKGNMTVLQYSLYYKFATASRSAAASASSSILAQCQRFADAYATA